MDKCKNDHYNSIVKYLIPVLILAALLTTSQKVTYGGGRQAEVKESCKQSKRLFTENSEEYGLAKRPNLTQINDSSVCESCQSGWCRGLLKFSIALFPESYTLADVKCFEMDSFPWPADPLMFPPQEPNVTPRTNKNQPLLSGKPIEMGLAPKI